MVSGVKVKIQAQELFRLQERLFGFGAEANLLTRDFARRVKETALNNYNAKPHPYSQDNSIKSLRIVPLRKNAYTITLEGGAAILERGRKAIKNKLMVFNTPDGRKVVTKNVDAVKPERFLGRALETETDEFPEWATVEIQDYFSD